MTQEELEQYRNFIGSGGGTNLAGQSMAGPVATGQSYAQSIAGGMPMSQVIAPGVSYSPEQAGGYTQADLDFIAKGPAPVMPNAPTTGNVATTEDQMPSAPPGVTQPTPFNIGNTLFPNVDYLQGLDFSGLPNFSNIDIDAIIKEYKDRMDAGEPEPFESFLTDVNTSGTNNSNLGLGLSNTFPPAMNFTNFTGTPTPESSSELLDFIPGSGMGRIGQGVATDRESLIGKTLFGQTSAVPRPPRVAYIPPPPPPPPPPAYIQPRVEEIVSPIRGGSTRQLPQPGLFNLV